MSSTIPERRVQLAQTYLSYTQDLEFAHLRSEGKTFVGGSGPLDARVMLIGEAPGAEENDAGRPFVGPSGEILDKLLKSVNLPRKEVFITNVVKYQTTNSSGNNRHPTDNEINASRQCLQFEISIVQPQVVALMGRTAMKFLSRLHWPHDKHGTIYRYTPTSRPVVLLYHPGVVIYEKSMMKTLYDDFQVILEALRPKE